MARLRRLIVDGSLGPGARLREVELAQRFSTSRTPVREALVALEREGMVTYERNRGFAVRQFSARDLYESYEMRAILEGYVCNTLAQRGLPDDCLRELQGCIDEVNAILARDTEPDSRAVAQWREVNLRFHDILMNHAGNALLDQTHRHIGRVPRVHDVFRAFHPNPRLTIHHYNCEHAQILDAIQQRNSGRAEFLMREHILQGCAVLKAHWEDEAAK
ncbi:GntR family transcriptional regulator [Achromobacter sp. GG226]|nr:GntR family transcriptional regulator [Verticiella sp. GG226]